MKKITRTCLLALFMTSVASAGAFAQSGSLNEQLKTWFNEVTASVEEAGDAVEKRTIIDRSLDQMLEAVDRVEKTRSSLSPGDLEGLASMRNEFRDMKDQLNGLNGFESVDDEELDDFVDYVQQSMEQAVNRTITISVGTAILIVLLLLLL